MVFDLLAPHLGYTQMRTAKNGWWGIARKPLDAATDSAQPRAGLLKGIRNAFAGR
jgi:hypothetical protein